VAPLLNRVVFTGRQVAWLLATDHLSVAPPVSFASEATCRALSPVSLDRLAVELQQLGFARRERTNRSDVWALDTETAIELVHISGDEADPAEIWLEYANLLTVPVEVGAGLRARITGAPALLALDWASFRASGRSALDSGDVEDVVALIAGRAEVVREVAVAPPELRTFVANETRRFLSQDCAEHAIRRALPGAAQLPALVARVAERMARIAA
jgi:hypothetical protein